MTRFLANELAFGPLAELRFHRGMEFEAAQHRKLGGPEHSSADDEPRPLLIGTEL
jgi:hypothetical protein